MNTVALLLAVSSGHPCLESKYIECSLQFEYCLDVLVKYVIEMHSLVLNIVSNVGYQML